MAASGPRARPAQSAGDRAALRVSGQRQLLQLRRRYRAAQTNPPNPGEVNPLSLWLAALLLTLAACGPGRAELDVACTAYDEATERLRELVDTVVILAETRVRADSICEPR